MTLGTEPTPLAINPIGLDRVPGMVRPRVLLADDHALLLGAFEKLLAEDCDIVGQVSDGRALVAAADAAQARHHRARHLDAAAERPRSGASDQAEACGDVKLVFVTMNEDTDLAAEAFRAGASGYVLKQSAASELLTAIRQVMEGRSYVTPLITEGLVGSLMHPDGSAPSHELTPRQREVLQLLAEGRSMKEVANLLNLTPRTVAFHKYRIMEQLKIKSTAELVQYAVKHHIV